QPGVVHARLNRYLKPLGLYFPPDPSNTEVTTLGSMLAIDAAGSRAIRVGSTRDHVNQIEIVMADGTCFEVGNESLSILSQPLPAGPATSLLGEPSSETRGEQVKRTVLSKLSKLLSDHEQLIQEKQQSRIPNCSGYFLKGIKTRHHLNLARLLVGSEGTLALFSSAVLHVSPLPAHRGVALLLFGDLASAIKAVQTIIHEQPSACDLLDRRLLSLAREADPRFASLISPAAEAALLVEQVGFSDSQVQQRLHNVTLAVKNINSRVVVAMETHLSDEVDFLWWLPQKVVPSLSRLPGESRPQPFVEDIAIPPECLYEFSQKAQKVFQRHQVTATLYAHAASGQIHLRPFLPALTEQNAPILESIARDLYQTVYSVNGTISGEHGDGLARTAFIRSQYGDLYRVFRQVKDIFDPHNLLNPGKIINDDPHVTIRHLRP
ncbi:MAG: FAD-binding oxidoreductase, partial [Planctomycetaceae bacterium]|nr:FAD-binding oxidoreductase [Planctomycetaceae bacterium]